MRPTLHGLLALLLYALAAAAAAALPEEDVPRPLIPWIDWVLYGTEESRCPLFYDDPRRRCAWPSVLSLEVAAGGGAFTQQWTVHAETWLVLPGERRHWPQEVRLDGSPAVVVERDGRPVVRAPVGDHTVSGRFIWPAMPESIQVPPETALLFLSVNGEPVGQPLREAGGTLWLRRQAAPERQDHVEFRVHRKVTDGIPLTLDTRLALEISGQAREVLLGRVLQPGFVPLMLDSPLPVRLEPDGRLRVQLRPGHWEIRLLARHDGPVDRLSPPAPDGPWAAQEVWVFEAVPALRVVSLEGPPPLDPAQTELPADWRRYPAFLMAPDAVLKLTTRQRGDADPAPDRLELEKTLWLDFDGGGYTVQDRLFGTVSRSARLEVLPPVQLGRVAIDGQEQFITRLEGTPEGVEIRRGRIELIADSRLEPESIGELPAVGWQLSPIAGRATLNLPPGWRLLAVQGADGASEIWLYRWTLLDLFVVLITAVSFARLWGWPYGILALAGLLLTYQEPNAPRLAWLGLLAAIALLRVLPPGRLQTAVRGYRNVAALVLVALALLFSIQQVRSALYPQLAPVTFAPFGVFYTAPERSAAERPAPASIPAAKAPEPRLQWYYTPDLRIQTGPGLPDWRWRQAVLTWNGPVAEDQRLELWLLPPWATRLALVAGVALIMTMLLRVLAPRGWKRPLAALLCVPFLIAMPKAQAEMPSPELLNELRARLTEAPDCLPGCAALATLHVAATPDTLTLRLDLHAQVDVAVPLPLSAEIQPQRVTLDGERPAALFRVSDGGLAWASLPAGLHSLVVQAPLPKAMTGFTIPLPMPPGRMELEVEGWLVEGVADGRAENSIRLLRPQSADVRLQAGALPVFASVERELVLGIDWQVHTQVRRLDESKSGATLEIPLLPGERVTTPGVRVRNGNVHLELPPDGFRWSSTLEKTETFVLEAVQTDAFVEVWRLRASPLWHVDSAGIPVIHRHDPQGDWAPQWYPWPGESVTLTISRPPGVEGRTLTIDAATLEVAPGERAAEASLELRIRTSRGRDHALRLPEGAELTGVALNGESQPIRQSGSAVVLPLAPGAQTAALTWRSPEAISARYVTPAVDLGAASVNDRIVLNLPRDRWTLFAGGPALGPAVLFWSVLAVIGLAALALGRFGSTPLKNRDWFLLGAGLSQAGIVTLLLVPGWLLLLERRRRLDGNVGTLAFDAFQVLLVVLTLAALAALVGAIQTGLLGLPEMQITGNGSSAYRMTWYQDRADGPMPQGWVVSVPLWVYRGLMLAWALWLAFALLRWLGWAWRCFSSGGIWRPLRWTGRQDREA